MVWMNLEFSNMAKDRRSLNQANTIIYYIIYQHCFDQHAWQTHQMFPCCQTNWDNFWYNKLHLKNLYILFRTVYWLKLSFFFYIKCFFVVVFIQILNSLQDCQLLPLEILYSRQLFNIYILAINESFIIVLHKIINSLPVLLFTMQLMSKHFFFKVKTRISHGIILFCW